MAHGATILRAATLSALLATVGAGCAGSLRVKPPSGDQRQSSSVWIYIQNDLWIDVQVYAVTGETATRLGQVGRFGYQTLRVPERCHIHDGILRLMVDPVGRREPVFSEPIALNPGFVLLSWVVESNLMAMKPARRSTDS